MMRADEPVLSAVGLLSEFNRAGVLEVPDVQLAQVVCRLAAISSPLVPLAAALAVRALRRGSVCVDLQRVKADIEHELGDSDLAHLPWPEVATWLAACAAEPGVGAADDPTTAGGQQYPYRLVGSLFYLNRWWAFEDTVATQLALRQSAPPPVVDLDELEHTLDQLFGESSAELPTPDLPTPDLQRRAVRTAVRSWTSVVAGGPGTGKTTTVARILAALTSPRRRAPVVALVAPSGKAAARLEQAVRSEAARLTHPMPVIPAGETLHRLLGARGLGNGFQRHKHNPLPHDVVVLDEASMVDVSMFAHLLAALRPTTRLVIVGDPHQLSSVDAGRVLADLAQSSTASSALTIGPETDESIVVELLRNYRNAGDIHLLAEAIKAGDADRALELLASADRSIEWFPAAEAGLDTPGVAEAILDQARACQAAGIAGDAVAALTALDRHRLLLAHRDGPYGVHGWTRQIQQRLGDLIPHQGETWFPGRPILVTTNSRDVNIFNGDAGVIVAGPTGAQLALPSAAGPRLISPSLVDGLESMYGLTVHKSQGSQFETVTVVLPPVTSPLLTRELLYTAVTRAIGTVRVVGSAASVRAAIEQPTERVSGLHRAPTSS